MGRREYKFLTLLFIIGITLSFAYWSPGTTALNQQDKPKEKPKIEIPPDAPPAKADQGPLQNWLYLCAPCHNVQATGTDFGPALLGPDAKRKLSVPEMIGMFERPEDHGLSEAKPAFDRLKKEQKVEMANWLFSLNKPEDIKFQTSTVKPPPFLFVQNCSGCHGADASGGICPNLHNIKKKRNRENIMALIENPDGAGLTKKFMPPFPELTPEERGEIADWLLSLE